jgi:hypothetical protein
VTSPRRRSRLVYAPLLVLTIGLGLASRRFAAALPDFVGAYAGDGLWAATVFWLAAMFMTRARTSDLAAGAMTTAVLVELGQLYHVPWLDAVRATRLGALLLGQGFLWSDLACYAAGVSAAALLDRSLEFSDRARAPHA